MLPMHALANTMPLSRHSYTSLPATSAQAPLLQYTAANTTDQQRVILFCDIERPLWGSPLRAFNRLFAKHFMAAASTQNVNGEPIGGINKVFAHAYKLRAAAKEFKRGNYRTYYVLKWLAIAGLVWAIFW